MTSQGYCHDGFAAVREAFEQNLTERDVGASFAATLNGEFVIDLWGGYADRERSRPWTQDTLVNVFSSTKTMTFLCILRLADQGGLDLNAPVCEYWPEFAQAGKDHVRVRHLMSHSSGVAGLAVPLSPELLYDWNRMCEQLASQQPWWPPGTASGYHALVQGHLLGEVVRRIDGRSLGRYFREEIAEPLDVDFHIGLAPSEFPRVADLIPYQPEEIPIAPAPGSVAERTLVASATDPAWTLTPEWRQAEIPAANGHGNARALAKAHAVLACGGSAWGQRVLSAEMCHRVLVEEISGTDLVIGVPVRFGLGYALPNETFSFSPNGRHCFWGGWGGSVVVADLEARVSYAYAMNRMEPAAIVGDERCHRLRDAFYGALQQSG